MVGANAARPPPTPNRLLVRGRVLPTPRWLVLGIFDLRNGLLYSTVDDNLEFVGPRNQLRSRTHRLEVGLERRFQDIPSFDPWIGVRVECAQLVPTRRDVRSEHSLAYGTFYNSEYRQVRIHIRFEK